MLIRILQDGVYNDADHHAREMKAGAEMETADAYGETLVQAGLVEEVRPAVALEGAPLNLTDEQRAALPPTQPHSTLGGVVSSQADDPAAHVATVSQSATDAADAALDAEAAADDQAASDLERQAAEKRDAAAKASSKKSAKKV